MALQLLYWFKSYSDFAEWEILPPGEAASGRDCACSLRSRLVFFRPRQVMEMTNGRIQYMNIPRKGNGRLLSRHSWKNVARNKRRSKNFSEATQWVLLVNMMGGGGKPRQNIALEVNVTCTPQLPFIINWWILEENSKSKWRLAIGAKYFVDPGS